ncbi:neuropeptide CCHamide 1 [Haematobia irritans]|uniref:neuropeptide CCHamide 1 n=1 Tax=Haematobia irritans TaxID=7368 RepID=UPI003F508062
MPLKTFYCVLLLFFLTFTMVKGSCLEYGHSCWGAHGKRSGTNKIHHTDKKSPTEVDFADLNAVKEPSYESSEDHVKNSYDTIPPHPGQDPVKSQNDLSNEMNNEKVLKLENLLLKQLNANGKHRMSEEATAQSHLIQPVHRTGPVSDAYISERWRRLPLVNFRRYPVANDKWLNDLENGPNHNLDDTGDYI